MGIYIFDYALNAIRTLTSSLSTAQSQAAKIDVLTVYKNNWLTSTNNNSVQSCASPGLYFEVNTGGDISVAMNALFQKAVATAYLSK